MYYYLLLKYILLWEFELLISKTDNNTLLYDLLTAPWD